jgi:mRNA interferase MazF
VRSSVRRPRKIGSRKAEPLRRFDIYLCRLSPTDGSEISKTRPVVVISPDELNKVLNTVIVAPLTSQRKFYRLRVQCSFPRQQSEIMIDQSRAVDKLRLINKVGKLSEDKHAELLSKLKEMFA